MGRGFEWCQVLYQVMAAQELRLLHNFARLMLKILSRAGGQASKPLGACELHRLWGP